MIHRSRRSATLPARRGMRAAWLRCRIPDELDHTGRAADDEMPAQDSRPPDEAGPADATLAAASDTTVPPDIVRPAFGHPTF